MEATKKKKAYLKPEMNLFEMKTEGFMVGSKIEVEVIVTPTEVEGLLQSKCTDSGTAFNQLVANLEPTESNGSCREFGAMHVTDDSSCGLWAKMRNLWLNLSTSNNNPSRVYICRLPDQGENRVYKARIIE